jgi:hypothetical protein
MQRHLGWPLPDLGDHDTDVQVVAGPNQSGAEPAPGRSAHQSIGDREELAERQRSQPVEMNRRIRRIASATRSIWSSFIPPHSGRVSTRPAAHSVTGRGPFAMLW